MAEDTTQRDAVESALRQLLPLFNHDELRVLEFDALRLLKGRDSYGPLDLSAKRDWAFEEFEEIVDARMYRMVAEIQRRDAARLQLHRDVEDELAAALPVCKAPDPARATEILAALQEFRDSSIERGPIEFDESDTRVVDETDITAEVEKR